MLPKRTSPSKPRSQTKSNTAGNIYLLQSGDQNKFKIGRTIRSATKRRKLLNTGNPEVLSTVQEWAVPRQHAKFEKLLHHMFQKSRIYNTVATEFFQFDDIGEVVAKIDRELLDFNEYTKRGDSILSISQEDEDCIQPNPEILELVKQRRALQAELKICEHKCSMVDAVLKAEIGTKGGVKIPSLDRPIVSWKTVKTTRFDHKRFKEDYEDLYLKYVSESELRRFCVN